MVFVKRELPILDLKPIIDNDQSKVPELIDAAERSLKEIGFFVVKNHGISDATIQETFAISKDFFDLEAAEKESVQMTADYPYGYECAEILSQSLTGEGTVPDPKETINIPVFNPRWPTKPAKFEEKIGEYCEQMWALTRHILKVFALVLRQEPEFFDDKFPTDKSNMTVFRQLNYPHMEGASDRIRASEHTDYGVLTILATGKIGGLQVKLEGQEWEHVSAPPGCLIVNIGDMMQRWSNDGWKSTLHRVVSLSDNTLQNNRRQSMAYFVNPGKNVLIECIPDYAVEGAAVKYPAVRAEDYILGKHYSTVPSITNGNK